MSSTIQANEKTSAVLIPAYNEAERIAEVIAVALASQHGEVMVVDDGSSDATSQVAQQAGARVHRLERNSGKGAALAAGARLLQSDVVILLDADLVGLTPAHIQKLAAPVLSAEVTMTRGIFTAGRWQTNFSQRVMPILNGQRALPREALLEVAHLAESRYGVEITISHHARMQQWSCRDVPLAGVSQIMKEEKRGWYQGVRQRLGMYKEIAAAWWYLR